MNCEKDPYKILNENEIKVTPQRIAVLEYLKGNSQHPSIDQVYTQVKRRFPYISRATVYNTVKVFIEAGVLKEILLNQEKANLDWNVTPHHHFKCLDCGTVEDLAYEVVEPGKATEHLEGYVVKSILLTVEGLCKACSIK